MMPADDSVQGTHFFLIAVQYKDQDGHAAVVSTSGTVTPEPWQTRLDMLGILRTWLEAQAPECRGGYVLSFDLQPNQL